MKENENTSATINNGIRNFVFNGRNLKLQTSDKCHYNSIGFEECHCNHCIDSIIEMDGIKKGNIYFNKEENKKVLINGIIPLENCVDFHWKNIENQSGNAFGCCMLSDLQ